MESFWRFLQPAIDLVDDLSLRVLPSERVGRVNVYYSCVSAEQAVLSVRLATGFAMLERRAPGWYRRVQEELKDILVVPLGHDVGGGWYDSANGLCTLNATPILELDDAVAPVSAMFILVHETAHAWLSRHKVQLDGERGRVREERICNRAEASLAARFPEMPGLASVVARRRASIPHSYDDAGVAARNARIRDALARDVFGGDA